MNTGFRWKEIMVTVVGREPWSWRRMKHIRTQGKINNHGVRGAEFDELLLLIGLIVWSFQKVSRFDCDRVKRNYSVLGKKEGKQPTDIQRGNSYLKSSLTGWAVNLLTFKDDLEREHLHPQRDSSWHQSFPPSIPQQKHRNTCWNKHSQYLLPNVITSSPTPLHFPFVVTFVSVPARQVTSNRWLAQIPAQTMFGNTEILQSLDSGGGSGNRSHFTNRPVHILLKCAIFRLETKYCPQ